MHLVWDLFYHRVPPVLPPLEHFLMLSPPFCSLYIFKKLFKVLETTNAVSDQQNVIPQIKAIAFYTNERLWKVLH